MGDTILNSSVPLSTSREHADVRCDSHEMNLILRLSLEIFPLGVEGGFGAAATALTGNCLSRKWLCFSSASGVRIGVGDGDLVIAHFER